MLIGANPLGMTVDWVKEERRFLNLLSFFASLPFWVLNGSKCSRCDFVKVFDNFTVGDSVKYFPICTVSFPFQSFYIPFYFLVCIAL